MTFAIDQNHDDCANNM